MPKVKVSALKSKSFLDMVARHVVETRRAAPSAVVVASVRRGGDWVTASGVAGAASASTIFDLASITKPVTALVAARLVRKGILTWSTRLGEVLAALAATPAARLPLDLLLAHRAGLEAHLPLYAAHVDGRAVDRRASARRSILVAAASSPRNGCRGRLPREGFAPVYSDMGYLLVGEMLATLGRRDLDALFEREVTGPLGLKEELGSARRLCRQIGARTFARRVAPTETVSWRGGTVKGTVHDENAWVFGGEAACGHAGLFGTGEGLARLGTSVLDALSGRLSSWLDPQDLESLVCPRKGGTLRAGFDGKSSGRSSAGTMFGPSTFGHLGFTGTSLWMDPEREIVGVLLTNRVHPTRKNEKIRRARPEVYDAIARWAERW